MRLILLFLLALPLAAPAETRAVPASAAEITLSFAPVVHRAAPAVANIYASRVVERRASPFAHDPFFSQFFDLGPTRPRVENALGSGVILSPDGFVVSNHHVIADAQEIRVVLSDRREYDGRVVMSDADSDIAVIRLEGAADLPVLEIGDSEAVEVGDLVLAIGNPFAVGQTVSSGIVSGLARSGANIGNKRGYYIQTDAAINPGNSGGALVDMKGRLIGINTSILTRSGGSNGIGFAIPAALVRQYLAQARAGNARFERPWAGIDVQPIDADLAEAMGEVLPQGVLIAGLHPDSPFAAAGVETGDILMAIDGAPVNAPEELDFRLATLGPEAQAVALIRRGAETTELTVTLAPPPDAPAPEPVRITGRTPFDGLMTVEATPRMVEELGLPLSTRGVLVLSMEGYATRLGLQPGDVILTLNGADVDTPETLQSLAQGLARAIDVTLLRDGRRLRLRYNF